jgi:hypothetical protein
MEVYRNVHLRCAKKVAPRRVRREECAAVRMDARVPGGSLVVTAVLRPRLSTENKLAAGVLGWVNGVYYLLTGYPPSPSPLNLWNHGVRHGLACKI